MEQISLCLTNYNRYELLLESFKYVIDDEKIGEIIISDDCSDLEIYKQVAEAVKDMPKVKLFRNDNNRDCYVNKMVSVSLATNPYLIVLDSDNIIEPDYLDRIYSYVWQPNIILTPDFAIPHLSYRKYSGLVINKSNISKYANEGIMLTCLNTMNFFVNKNEFLKVWRGDINPYTFDSLYFNYCWLAAGNNIHIVKGLSYQHRIHNGSHYDNNNHKSGNLLEEIKQKLKALQ